MTTATGNTKTSSLWGNALCDTRKEGGVMHYYPGAARSCYSVPITIWSLASQAYKNNQKLYHKKTKKVRSSISTEHTFIEIVALKSNIMLTCCVFFLEWHFVLKALTTFTFIQPKRKHLWGVKIAFGDKTESEQEHKKWLLTETSTKKYTSSTMF